MNLEEADERVAAIARALRPHLPPEVLAVDVEAPSLRVVGGVIYLPRNLLDGTDDAVALRLARELAHRALGHHTRWRFLASAALRDRDADLHAIELCLDAGYDVERCLAAVDDPARAAAIRAHAEAYRAGAANAYRTALTRRARRRQMLNAGFAALLAVIALAVKRPGR
jgi:hypothetical protein